MIFNQFKEFKKLFYISRIKTGVDFVKITLSFLEETFIFLSQFQGLLKIFGIMLLKANGDFKFLIGLTGIENILQFFFLNLLPGVHERIILQPDSLVKPESFKK